jgi:hypothetical protein
MHQIGKYGKERKKNIVVSSYAPASTMRIITKSHKHPDTVR